MLSPFIFCSIQPYPPVAIAVLFYLEFVWGCPSPTFWWSMSHFSCHYKLSPLQAQWGRWRQTCLLWLACLFTVPMGKCPLPSSAAFHMTAAVTSFPHSKVAGWGPPLLPSPSGLFIYSSHEGVLLAHSPEPMAPCPLCYVSFFFQLLVYYSVFFFFFTLDGSQSVQGAMLICPGEYRMLLICSPGGLCLPSRVGAGVWWCKSPPGFSI
jgi:hypothetical protein